MYQKLQELKPYPQHQHQHNDPSAVQQHKPPAQIPMRRSTIDQLDR